MCIRDSSIKTCIVRHLSDFSDNRKDAPWTDNIAQSSTSWYGFVLVSKQVVEQVTMIESASLAYSKCLTSGTTLESTCLVASLLESHWYRGCFGPRSIPWMLTALDTSFISPVNRMSYVVVLSASTALSTGPCSDSATHIRSANDSQFVTVWLTPGCTYYPHPKSFLSAYSLSGLKED